MGASFRNTEQVLALTGCDKLTISPALLDELAQSTSNVTPTLIATTATQTAKIISEAEFRLALAMDAMANEKLAQGIQAFIKDQETLEQRLLA